jgi:DNA replication protein DnaC
VRGPQIPATYGHGRKGVPSETQYDAIITTNLDFSEWAGLLGNVALVEALLSRLRHHCHTVRIEGPSLREPQG